MVGPILIWTWELECSSNINAWHDDDDDDDNNNDYDGGGDDPVG
jgi:hypothetical protein